MRVAVLFTGALRTIKKTMRYFKQNILLTSDVAVFACIQNDTSEPDSKWEAWLHEQIGDHLNLEWYTLSNEWITHREKLLANISIDDTWKNYLRTSGSMIEYIQLQYAYMAMCKYEQLNEFTFNYIIKSRTDSIFAKPVDFHWLNWSDEEITQRVEKIRSQMLNHNIELTDTKVITYFMTTILSDNLISNLQNINTNYIPAKDGHILNTENLPSFLRTGTYILTIRVNNLYVVNRSSFYLIPSLGHIYGLLRYPYEDDYWFNAENQFCAACYHSNLHIFNYETVFDGESLYNYDEQRYFDSDYNIINPYMLYCVVRR